MVDATVWLEENYPTNGTCTRIEDTDNCSPGKAKIRSEITDLNVSNQDLEGFLNVYNNGSGFLNLKKLNISFNKIHSSWWPSSEEIDFSHNLFAGYINSTIDQIIKKFNFSFNSFDYFVIENSPQLTHLDVSNNRASELNITGSDGLIHLDASNNSLKKLNIDSPWLSYLDASNNALQELDLSIITDLQTLNCSNNRNLADLTLPNNFKPEVLDCSKTSLKNLTFSNSSTFDCEKGRLISESITSTMISASPTTTTQPTIITTSANNDLALNLGLGLGIPLAVILVSLTAFFGYKWGKRQRAIPTAGSN